MYNLAKAVGPNRANMADDVRLVQSLFKAARQVGDPFMSGVPPVALTGSFSPSLAEAILTYQKGFAGTPARVAADGVIDPLPSRSGLEGDWDQKYGGGATSTLLILNYRLFKRSREIYMKIGEDLSLPWKPDPFTI